MLTGMAQEVFHVGFEGRRVRGSSRVIDSPIPPWRVIEAISVVFLPRFLGTCRRPSFLRSLALRRVMEVLKPDSSTNTSLLASKRLASHRHNPLASSSRSEAICDFFERPSPLGSSAMALPRVEVETLCPNSSSKAWRCSSRVRSSLASRCCGASFGALALFWRSAGIGLGLTSPV